MVVIGAVAEVLAREGVGHPLEPVGYPDRFIVPGGPFDNLAERIGLTRAGIRAAVERVLDRADGRGSSESRKWSKWRRD
jgi:deoxyxylulose-5-phosphate synthase